jgi:hypothetical protein
MIRAIINITIFMGILSIFLFAVTQFLGTEDEFQIILSDTEITLSPTAIVTLGITSVILIWLFF